MNISKRRIKEIIREEIMRLPEVDDADMSDPGMKDPTKASKSISGSTMKSKMTQTGADISKKEEISPIELKVMDAVINLMKHYAEITDDRIRLGNVATKVRQLAAAMNKELEIIKKEKAKAGG